jgi:hypothetical protein
MAFLFWLLFFSISFLSVLTSIFFKNGQTIQVILFPLLIFSIYFVFQSKEYKVKITSNYFFRNKKKIFVLALGSIFIWLLNAVFVFDISSIFEGGNNFNFLIPSKDSFFYGRLSEKLLTSAYETAFALHEDLPTVLGTTPYHYFEFWLSAFFCKIFSVSGFVAYSLFTIPVLQICAWIGILAIYEQQENEKEVSKSFIWSCLWAFGLLFLGGIYLPFYSTIKGFQATYWLANTIFTGLSEYYFFWIAIFLSFQIKNYRACIWIIFMLPIISPTLWAACWAGLFFIGSFLFYQQKVVFLKKYKLESIAFFLIPLCYFLFYYFTQSSQSVANSDVSILTLSKNKISVFSIFKEIIIYLFGFFVIYIPFLILFLRTWKLSVTLPLFVSLQTTYLFFFIGGILGGIVFYFLLPIHQERFQFLRNFIIPFVQVSLIYYFIIKQNYLNNKVKVIFVILLLYGFGFTIHWFLKETQPNQTYSQGYLNVLDKELIQKKELKRGAIFHASNYYDDKILFNRNENFEIEGRYLAFKKGLERFYNLDMVCLKFQENDFSFSKTDFFAVWLKDKIESEKMNTKMICNDSLKWLFVEEQKLDFVIIGKDVFIPTKTQSKIKFQVEDNLSGEIFLRLK